MSPPGDFFEDVSGCGGPDEGFRIGIMVLQVVFDGGFEVGDAAKHAAADGILGDQPEEALDLVEPRGGSRREVEMKARMAFQPCFDLGMLVGGIVVDHQMEGRALGVLRSMRRRKHRNSW